MRTILFITFISVSTFIYAQGKYALTVGAGSAYYFGDLAEGPGNAHWRPAMQIAFSQYFSPRFSFRVGVNHGYIGADDRKATDITRQERALHFKSRVTDFNLTGVFQLLKPKTSEEGDFMPSFSPYVFGGIALLSFNPQGEYNGLWYDLKSMGTEGQDIPVMSGEAEPAYYNLVQPTIPLGLGISYRASKSLALNFELGYRYTLTDHLDDVGGTYPDGALILALSGEIATHFTDPSGRKFPSGTPRGNANNRDSYLFGTFSISFFFDQ